MADELPDFPAEDPFESDGQIISRSLSSSRSGRTRAPAIPLQFRVRQQEAAEQDKEWRRDIEERKFEVTKLAEQTARETARLKAAEVKFNILEKITGIKDKEFELNDSIRAMEEFNALDYKDGATPNRIADIYKRNPRALDNPRVASFADRLIGMHENFLKDFRTDVKTDAEKEAAKAAEIAAEGLGMSQTDLTTKVGETTKRFETPAGGRTRSTTPETDRLTDINKRLSAEYGVDLADVNNPAGNMRRVDPSKPEGKKRDENGDPNGSHYAFTVKKGDTEKTVLIPVDRFKAYADEYAAAKAKPVAPAPAAPASTPPVVASVNQAAIDWLAANPGDPRAAAVKAKLGIK